uniref:Uncharacterized protein n=1 Tax=Panagrolaimus davidi TaxID=227884 RepID=A0A914PPU2_9BILA
MFRDCLEREIETYLEVLASQAKINHMVAIENEVNLLTTNDSTELKKLFLEFQLLHRTFYLSSLNDPILDKYGLSFNLTLEEIFTEHETSPGIPDTSDNESEDDISVENGHESAEDNESEDERESEEGEKSEDERKKINGLLQTQDSRTPVGNFSKF